VTCLKKGRLPETHACENYESLRLMFPAHRSAETNQVASLDDYEKLA
jgi:hypothetical protein